MLRRLYVHHYRCLQNFTLALSSSPSALVVGRNGAGKSSLFAAIGLLQKVGRGVSATDELLRNEDLAFKDSSQPVIFEIDAQIDGLDFTYRLELDLPRNFRALRVSKELLHCGGEEIFARTGGRTQLHGRTEFTLDWHHVGLPLLSVRNDEDPIARFRHWLGKTLVLAPAPEDFVGRCKSEQASLNRRADNLTHWLRHHLGSTPALYTHIDHYLRIRMPDFDSLRLEVTGKEERELLLRFKTDQGALELGLEELSSGEKIYLLCALLLALIQNGEPLLCLWDEIDHYVALPELAHFVGMCRKAFEQQQGRAQLILTTHNARVMYEFSRHNTWIMQRDSHLQPTRITRLEEISFVSPDAVQAFENGELG